MTPAHEFIIPQERMSELRELLVRHYGYAYEGRWTIEEGLSNEDYAYFANNGPYVGDAADGTQVEISPLRAMHLTKGTIWFKPYKVMFRDKEDAVMFKLQWSEDE